MDLVEALSKPPVPPVQKRIKPEVPKVGEPGSYEYDGREGVIYTRVTEERPKTWDDFILDSGLDPEEVEVIEPVQVRGWDSIKREWNAELQDFESNVVRMHYYRLLVRRRRFTATDLEELIKLVRDEKRPKKLPTGEATFVVALGDLQIGKGDGDGPEGTVQRVVDGLVEAAERLKAIRAYKSVGPVLLSFLGDCIEGFVSQGGGNAWRTVLQLTEQLRVLRRIMLEAVKIFAPLTDQLHVVAVPGNHDEAVRFGKGITTYDDSFDLEMLLAVEDAVRMNNAFDHVKFYVPGRDEMDVTIELSGSKIGHIHGHQTKARQHFTWWSKQSFGDQRIGEADILMAGHFHHFILDTSGKRKFIQVPALESESTYYKHRHGEVGDPGVLTFVTQNATVNNIEIV